MHRKLKLSAAATLLVVAAMVAAGATAGRTAAPQRVAITSPHGNSAAFVLAPLAPGSVLQDSGTATACCWTRRFIRRDGQSIEIDNPLRTFEGKRGTFTWRARIEWVDLDSGYSIGTGTWKIVRGTGAYAHLEGHGRIGIVTTANDQGVANRAEGVVDLGR
ncbi:MAG TPA: hypothetical protein VFA96_08015 [Nocardioides sp.]|nr:hypothetical protein [Nocardioides sp.]